MEGVGCIILLLCHFDRCLHLTTNIYAQLDYSSKLTSVDVMRNGWDLFRTKKKSQQPGTPVTGLIFAETVGFEPTSP